MNYQSIQHIGVEIMYRNKLEELEHKLNPKTNGFALFKEIAGAAVGWGMRTADQGLEAIDNIRPPTENEFDEEFELGIKSSIKNHDTINGLGNAFNNIAPPKEIDVLEGLNIPKQRSFEKGDKVRVVDIPEGAAASWLNGAIGIIKDPNVDNSDSWLRPKHVAPVKEAFVEFMYDNIPNTTGKLNKMTEPLEYAIQHKYLQHVRQEVKVNEVSPYEESDWLISESHKQEVKKIEDWLKTTSEPYDDFHWNGADLLILREGKVVETIERSVLVQQNIVSDTRIINEYRKSEYGCLMTYLDIPMWNDVMALIDPDDLYTEEEGFGLETTPHATILFGIRDNEINIDDIRNDLLGLHEIPIKVTGISHFTLDNQPYDVIKFDLESEMLCQLNQQFQKFPHTDEFNYNPHMTIGYVKKGLGAKYNGKMPSVPTILGKKIVYSRPSGKKDVWELPIQSDVMNSPDDLMEGLNLPKKPIQKRLITQIYSMVLPNSGKVDISEHEFVNRNYIEEIEATTNWQNIQVDYIDLNGQTQTTNLREFSNKYFKIGLDCVALLDNVDFLLEPITCFRLVRVENNRNGQIIKPEDIDFFEKLEDLLSTNDDLNYVGHYIDEPDFGDRVIVLEDSEIEGPAVIILFDNTFHMILDSKVGLVPVEI